MRTSRLIGDGAYVYDPLTLARRDARMLATSLLTTCAADDMAADDMAGYGPRRCQPTGTVATPSGARPDAGGDHQCVATTVATPHRAERRRAPDRHPASRPGPFGAITVLGDSVLLGSGFYGPTLVDQLASRGWGPIRFKAGVGHNTGNFGGQQSVRTDYWIAAMAGRRAGTRRSS